MKKKISNVIFFTLTALIMLKGVAQPSFVEKILFSNGHSSREIIVVDLDKDNDSDLVYVDRDLDFFNLTNIAWLENLGGGNFTSEMAIHIVDTSLTAQELAERISIGDVDGDGDLDIITPFYDFSGHIAWFRNDGNQNFSKIIFDTLNGYGVCSVPFDMNKDGFMEIIIDNSLSYYPNNSGFPDANIVQIASTGYGSYSPCVADFNNDGFSDVAVGWQNNVIAWYQNFNGTGFSNIKVIDDTADVHYNDLTLLDFNGDQYYDLLFPSSDINISHTEDRVMFYKNDGTGNFSNEVLLDYQDTNIVIWGVDGADLDNDGLKDLIIVYSRDSDTGYYFNNGTLSYFLNQGNETFSIVNENIISKNLHYARLIKTGDLDNDGDLDIISAEFGNGKVAWFQNQLISNSLDEKMREKNLLKIFPSPAGSHMTVVKFTNETQVYQITDLAGKVIAEGLLINDQTIINISGLAIGAYLLSCAGNSYQIIKQ